MSYYTIGIGSTVVYRTLLEHVNTGVVEEIIYNAGQKPEVYTEVEFEYRQDYVFVLRIESQTQPESINGNDILATEFMIKEYTPTNPTFHVGDIVHYLKDPKPRPRIITAIIALEMEDYKNDRKYYPEMQDYIFVSEFQEYTNFTIMLDHEIQIKELSEIKPVDGLNIRRYDPILYNSEESIHAPEGILTDSIFVIERLGFSGVKTSRPIPETYKGYFEISMDLPFSIRAYGRSIFKAGRSHLSIGDQVMWRKPDPDKVYDLYSDDYTVGGDNTWRPGIVENIRMYCPHAQYLRDSNSKNLGKLPWNIVQESGLVNVTIGGRGPRDARSTRGRNVRPWMPGDENLKRDIPVDVEPGLIITDIPLPEEFPEQYEEIPPISDDIPPIEEEIPPLTDDIPPQDIYVPEPEPEYIEELPPEDIPPAPIKKKKRIAVEVEAQ